MDSGSSESPANLKRVASPAAKLALPGEGEDLCHIKFFMSSKTLCCTKWMFEIRLDFIFKWATLINMSLLNSKVNEGWALYKVEVLHRGFQNPIRCRSSDIQFSYYIWSWVLWLLKETHLTGSQVLWASR
jgi:hypothetical protein